MIVSLFAYGACKLILSIWSLAKILAQNYRAVKFFQPCGRQIQGQKKKAHANEHYEKSFA